MLDAVAQRYFCLPSDVREADTYNLRIIRLLEAAGHFGEPKEQSPAADADPFSDLPIEVL